MVRLSNIPGVTITVLCGTQTAVQRIPGAACVLYRLWFDYTTGEKDFQVPFVYWGRFPEKRGTVHGEIRTPDASCE